MTTASWSVYLQPLPLELEVEQHNFLSVQIVTRDLAVAYTVLVYYGHPLQKQRTARDLQRIEDFAACYKEPLILLSDVNISDEDRELTPDGLHLQDSALLALRQEDVPLEPTHDGPYRQSRIDRIFLSEVLAKAQIHYEVGKDVLFAGHSPLTVVLACKLPQVLTRIAEKPLCGDTFNHDPQAADRAGDNVDCTLQDSHAGLDQQLRAWESHWRSYLCIGAGRTCPNKDMSSTTPKLTRLNVTRENLPKSISRLANFLHDVRRLLEHPEPGHPANAACWSRIRRTSVAMALKYGIPEVMNQQFEEQTVVKDMLALTFQHYKLIYDMELQHHREDKLQRGRHLLNANKGVNARVARTLKGKRAKIPITVKYEGRIYKDYPTMLSIVHHAWSEYFQQKHDDNIDDWADKYLKKVKPVHCPLPRLHAEDLQAILSSANAHATAGPDNWYTSDIKQLPERALQQLACIFNRCETQGYFPTSMLRSWTCMIPKSMEAQAPTSLRPIAVLSALYRLYASARQASLSGWFSEVCPEEILSYLPKRSTAQAAIKISMQVEEVREKRQRGAREELHMASLDASKAFPSVNRSQLWRVLERANFGESWNEQGCRLLSQPSLNEATIRPRPDSRLRGSTCTVMIIPWRLASTRDALCPPWHSMRCRSLWYTWWSNSIPQRR